MIKSTNISLIFTISSMLNCVGQPMAPESSALIEAEKQQPPPESCEEEYDYNNL